MAGAEDRALIERLTAPVRDYRRWLEAEAAQRGELACYGCGAVFAAFVGIWNRLGGRKVDAVYDADAGKWGRVFHGVVCRPPEELFRRKGEATVFLTLGDWRAMRRRLEAGGVRVVAPIHINDLRFHADGLARDAAGIRAKLAEGLGRFSEPQSREVFLTVARRILAGGDEAAMYRLAEGDQYFPAGLIRLGRGESFVDAGAYDGDTVAEFLRRTHGEFRSCHAFELDADNLRRLRERLQSLPGGERVTVHPQGLGDREEEVRYGLQGPSCSIGAGDDAAGRIVPLDRALDGAPVSFIKMDIEGFELRALAGARETIRRHVPVLAISVYHELSHLWEVPELIQSFCPAYRLFLRHHTVSDCDTVCYALPPERKGNPA